MISVSEAQETILERAAPLLPSLEPLTTASLGLILAEDVAADIDMPPFDKALMDGFALRSSDVCSGVREFKVTQEVLAGGQPSNFINSSEAARIMTGAPLPEGADAVVMYERTSSIDDGRVKINELEVGAGQNILPCGREMRSGEVVVHMGTTLRPQEYGLLASVGRSSVMVYPRPVVALLSTGDEVIEPPMKPGPGQIRNSNATMLAAQVTRAGGLPRYLGIARDTVESLTPLITEGLKADLFIVSGGVSAGKVDLVPKVLQGLGVQSIFHRVAMKPGKPIFYGVKDKTHVFGLPGNPVSSLVGFELFVRTAMNKLMGHESPLPRTVEARLRSDFSHRSDRPTYHPAQLETSSQGWEIETVPWFGSADLRAVVGANAFALFPPGENEYKKGSVIKVLAPESY